VTVVIDFDSAILHKWLVLFSGPAIMGVIRNLLVRVIDRVKEIPRRGFPELRDHPSDFDREHGVDTSGIVWLTNPFSKNFTHGIRYQPCAAEACRWAIDAAGIDTKDYCFLDVGCGKGRALIVASFYEFPRVIGVEYSRRLCRQARSNLAHCGVAAERYEIVCTDAATYDYPDGNLFVFLNNPFDTVMIRVVLQRLRNRSGSLFVAFEGAGRVELQTMDWLSHVGEGPDTDLFRSVG